MDGRTDWLTDKQKLKDIKTLVNTSSEYFYKNVSLEELTSPKRFTICEFLRMINTFTVLPTHTVLQTGKNIEPHKLSVAKQYGL